MLRNLNEHADIKIDRVRVYFKDGTLAFDSDVLGHLPAGQNNIINPSNNVLKPHQVEQYNSEQVFGYAEDQIPPLQQGHVEIDIDWSSAANENPLLVSNIRNVYDLNLSNMPIARNAGKCEAVQ